MKNTLKEENWKYQDQNWKNRFLKLLICCTASAGIHYILDFKNFDKSDLVFSIIFGIIIWIVLIVQRKI